MRDVKFRAINVDGGLVYGLPYTDGTNDTVYFKDYSNRLCWRDENGAHCNQPYKNGTLMQFTGKQDSEGMDVYEGDIIEFNIIEWGGDDNIHLVTWDEDNAEWSWGGGSTSDMQFRTVIGNIYQNANLINK